jgi:glyoxylase-like metal-dependent hydrolase (beta-lactamase superfamily II)/rhodanese-related sulfurtransferase
VKIQQLFDEISSTYTYMLIDETSNEAIIIDPVDRKLERDLAVIKKDSLLIKWIIETHAHADHITSAAKLAELTGGKLAAPKACDIRTATWQLENKNQLNFGSQSIIAISTPGHTAGSMSFLCGKNVFTGDTLLINGCGRTDFQSGSSADLFHSITCILFQLPDDVVVWPGHDYNGKKKSTIGIEKKSNSRIAGQSKESFIQLMAELNLPRPKLIDVAVPANKNSGLRPEANDFANAQTNLDQGYAGDVSNQIAWSWFKSKEAVLIDVRTQAEIKWVGFIPGSVFIPWRNSPNLTPNDNFNHDIKIASAGKKVLFLCSSGIKSIEAAKRATELGIVAYSILEGFDGAIDSNAQRSRYGGWKSSALPWRQN